MKVEITTMNGNFTVDIIEKDNFYPYKKDTMVFFMKVPPFGSEVIICIRNPEGKKIPLAFTDKRHIEEYLLYQGKHFIKSKNKFSGYTFVGMSLESAFKAGVHDYIIINPPKEMDIGISEYFK